MRENYDNILNNEENAYKIFMSIKDLKIDIDDFLEFYDQKENLTNKNLKDLTNLCLSRTDKKITYGFIDKYFNYLEKAPITERISFINDRFINKINLFDAGFIIKNKEEAKAIVEDYGPNLRYIPQFNNDKEVVLLACRGLGFSHPSSIQYASESLRDDLRFMQKILEIDSLTLIYASDRIKNSCDIDTAVKDITNMILSEDLASNLKEELAEPNGAANKKIKV